MIVSLSKSSMHFNFMLLTPSLTWHHIVIFSPFQYEEQFKTILSGVRGDNNTKKLASQFTSRFFSKFPTLANDSLDAILDLCEDDNVDIRKQAIKDLPSLCREMKEFLPKIADVLSQLLQTEDKGVSPGSRSWLCECTCCWIPDQRSWGRNNCSRSSQVWGWQSSY